MTRVRIIYQIGPSAFFGKMALNQVTKVCASYGFKAVPMPGQPAWKAAQYAMTLTQKAGYDIGRFLVYREPRNVNAQRSPYQQALRTIHGGQRHQRPRLHITPPPAHPKPNKLRSRTVKMLEQELMLD